MRVRSDNSTKYGQILLNHSRSASASALDASGYLKLAADQCYYSAMMTHVSLWTNTPSILSLPYSMDDTWEQIAHDFRIYLGPRLGVLAMTQQLSAPINIRNFACT